MENEEHEEQSQEPTPSESTEPQVIQAKGKPIRLVVMCVLLAAMVAMAFVQSGARRARDAAVLEAKKMMDGDDTVPADYMKATGITPRIISKDGSLVQVYRWKGVLMHFEMHVTFFGEKGYYTIEKVLPLDVPLHKKSNYSQLKLAGKTGTEYDVFPKEPSPKDGNSGAMPKGNGKGAPGGPGGDLGGGPGGGPNGPGTPGGMSEERMKERMAAPFKDLKLDAAQQAKLDAILEKQLSEAMTILGDSSQEMRARFGALRALREKYEVQYKEVLSAEQFEAYQKAREAARGQRGGRGGRGGGGGFGEPPGGPPVGPPGGEGGPVERDSPSPRPEP